MLRRYLVLLSVVAIFLSAMESCFIFKPKNKCDGCPGLVKRKKAKKATKGSI